MDINMDINAVPAGSIVVGIDGSSLSDEALEWGAHQAALEGRSLTLVHAVTPMGVPSSGMYGAAGVDYARYSDEMDAAGRSMLAAAAERARAFRPGLDIHEVLPATDPRTAMLGLAEQATMIVVGSRGLGSVASLLLGSVSVSVAKHATCPVIVVRSVDRSPPRHGIVVGVDGSERSLAAIELAYRLASFRATGLTVLHGFWTPDPVVVSTSGAEEPDVSDERALVSESLAGMGEKFPDVEVRLQLVRGPADQALLAASRDAELLVVGHHRGSALDTLLHDSVAATVLEHAHSSVAVVPARTLSAPSDTSAATDGR
ncbi:universal stress protein [soil metagenome]